METYQYLVDVQITLSGELNFSIENAIRDMRSEGLGEEGVLERLIDYCLSFGIVIPVWELKGLISSVTCVKAATDE